MQYEDMSLEENNKKSELPNKRFINLSEFLRDKRQFAPMVLLAIAALSGILIVAKAAGLFIASARAERIVKQATTWSKPDPNIVESQVAKSKLIAEDLKENNLFWPTPKGHPVQAVLGIFGDEAYIDGNWYKVGSMIRDAKIIAIDANSVTTEWKGKKQIFCPIDADGSPTSGGP